VWIDGASKGSVTGAAAVMSNWAGFGAASYARAAHDGRIPAGEPNLDWPGGANAVVSDLLVYIQVNNRSTCDAPQLTGAWEIGNQTNLEYICCSPCPAGSILAANGIDCQCDVGFEGRGMSCKACAAGKYKDVTGSFPCIQCGEGTYSTEVGAVSNITCETCPSFSTAIAGSSNISNCTCNAGYTGPDGEVCSACEAGKFKTVIGSAPCSACSIGTYLDRPGQTACRECPAGTVSRIGSAAQSMCTADAVQVEVSSNIDVNLTTFRRLEDRMLHAYAAVTRVSRSMVKLLSAREISRPVSAFRRLFAAGSVNITVIDVQITVPQGFAEVTIQSLTQNLTAYVIANGLPTVSVNAIKQSCGAGAEPKNSGKQCGPCDRGFFKSKADNSSCLRCVANSSTASVGAVLVAECTCNAGYFSTKALDENASCVECGLGRFCTGNQSRDLCPAGSYGDRPTLAIRSMCRLCPNRTSSLAGSTEAGNCSCDKGYTGPNNTACEACGMGYYKPVIGDGIKCTACAAGKYLDRLASASDICEACSPHSFSEEGSPLPTNCTCNRGHSGPDGGLCTACQPGTYKAATGSAICVDCQAGTYALLAATICVLCPSDTFSGATSAPSEASCESCPQFSHSPAGSVSRSNCICVPGRYDLDLECVQCKVCDPGKSVYRFDRASCLPCSGQENHDKYAGQGAIPDDSCQGSDVKYGYDYAYTRNDLRLEWHADWLSLYPWVPRCVFNMNLIPLSCISFFGTQLYA